MDLAEKRRFRRSGFRPGLMAALVRKRHIVPVAAREAAETFPILSHIRSFRCQIEICRDYCVSRL
jgi:hypothetical protein